MDPDPAAPVGRQLEAAVGARRRVVSPPLTGSHLYREQVDAGVVAGTPIDVGAVWGPDRGAEVEVEVEVDVELDSEAKVGGTASPGSVVANS